MALEFTDKEDIPESMQNDFTEFEKDGKKVFIPSDTADALKAQFRLQGDLTSITESQKTLQSQVTGLMDEKQSLADEKESLRVSSLSQTEQVQEQIDYLKNQMQLQKDSSLEQIKTLTDKANRESLEAIVSDLSTTATPSEVNVLKRMIRGDLRLNDDGTTTVLDENGKATTQTLGEYKESLPERYPGQTAAVRSEGGEGKGNNGETVDVGGKKYSDLKTPAEKAAYLKKKYKR